MKEPEYTRESWELAGFHGARRPVVTFRDAASKSDPYAVFTTVHSVPNTADTRAIAVDMVRRAIGGDLPASQLMPMVRSAVQMVRDPRDTATRAAAMANGIGSRDVEPVATDVTDADVQAEQKHSVTVKRSRSGRTSTEVKRYGIARVIGAYDVRSVDASADLDVVVSPAACVAFERAALHLRGVRRNSVGANAFDVLAVTDHHYRPLGLPALEGSEVRSWSKGPSVDRSDRSVAAGPTGIDGTHRDTTANEIARHGDANGSQTGAVKPMPSRLSIGKGKARSGDPVDSRRFVVASDGTTTSEWSLVAPTEQATERATVALDVKRNPRVVAERHSLRTLPYRRWQVRPDVLTYAPMSNASMEREALFGRTRTVASDKRFVGHTATDRPTTVRQERKRASVAAKNKRDAQTIGTVAAPTTETGWVTLLDALNRGERVKVKRTDGATLTVLRNSQRYETRGTVDGVKITWKVRSAATMAQRLASLDI